MELIDCFLFPIALDSGRSFVTNLYNYITLFGSFVELVFYVVNGIMLLLPPPPPPPAAILMLDIYNIEVFSILLNN